jgi:hypothetical protein
VIKSWIVRSSVESLDEGYWYLLSAHLFYWVSDSYYFILFSFSDMIILTSKLVILVLSWKLMSICLFLLLQVCQCTSHEPNVGCCCRNATKPMCCLPFYLNYLHLAWDYLATYLSLVICSFLQTHRKVKKQQGLHGLTSALDKTLQADTAENTSYKFIDVVCNIISLLGLEHDT